MASHKGTWAAGSVLVFRLVRMPLAPRFRALSAALLAFGLVAGALTTATLHAPAARADAPTDTADVPGEAESDAAPPTLLVAPTDAVIRPGTTEVEFTLLLRNPGTEPLPGGRVELRFGTTPVPDRGGITAELAAGSPRIAEAEFGTTDAGEEADDHDFGAPRSDPPGSRCPVRGSPGRGFVHPEGRHRGERG